MSRLLKSISKFGDNGQYLWAKFFKTTDLQIYRGHSEINRPVITNYGQEIFMPRTKLFPPFMQDLATNTVKTT